MLETHPHLLKVATVPSVVEEVNVLTHDRDQMLWDLKENLAKAQNQMKKYAGHSRRPIQLTVWHWVYLKLQPYRLWSLARKMNLTRSQKQIGAYCPKCCSISVYVLCSM